MAPYNISYLTSTLLTSMSTTTSKMRSGGRNSIKGRGTGVYGAFKSQEEEQQPLAAAVDTSQDDFMSGAQVDSLMQHAEHLNPEGAALGRVHDLTSMLEGTDLDEDHKKGHVAELDSSGLNLPPSTAP